VYKTKPIIIIKLVVPLASKLMDDIKPDYKAATIKLLQILHVSMGPTLDEQMAHAKLVKYHDLIKQ
jgi:hypothetical protein